MPAAIDDRICHVYLKYTAKQAGEGVTIDEEVAPNKVEQIEVCGTRLLARKVPTWDAPDDDIWYCPTCDLLDTMLPPTVAEAA